MGKCRTVIHANGQLAHQVRIAAALHSGTGWEVSFRPDTEADCHVVLGPWFALDRWRYAKTLYVDRAYWGDPYCVSIHWLAGGEKVRLKGMPYRDHPELHPMKTGNRRVYLCDYKAEPEGQYDTVRYHPVDRPATQSLQEILNTHDIAIGRRTTALVDAAIAGLRVETSDPHSPVYGLVDRAQWIIDLAWHNWSLDEIARGVFLDAIGRPYSEK
jgi:hypothetical protein